MNKIKTLAKISSLAIAFMFVMSIFAQAQGIPPLVPVNVKSVILQQDYNGATVLLTWDKNADGPIPTHFSVFMAKKNSDDMKDFVLMAEIKYLGKDNIPFEVKLPYGEFSFYVKAVIMRDGERLTSAPSPIIKVKIDQKDYKFIQISSKLPNEGGIMMKIGDTFKYKVEYKTNVTGTIKFRLEGQDIPADFTIDGTNGTINWTPTQKSMFGGSIIAYSVDTPTILAQQYFKMYADSGKFDPPKDAIRITSIPNPNFFVQLKIGETFAYKVTYETTLKDEINFKLEGQRPEDFKIGTKSGEIVWTAKANGSFAAIITAYSTANPKIMAQQAFKVYVGTGYDDQNDKNKCAIITGKVTLEDGTVATEGVIQAWLPNTDKKGEARFDAGINKEGIYAMKVPVGSYLLEAWGKTFQHEWFENATDVASATKVEVVCNDTVKANFIVKLIPVPKNYTVSGTVTSELDGTPLAAYVSFTPIEVLSGQTKDAANKAFVVKTDVSGNYTINLPDNFTYRAYANVGEKASNYIGEYYDNVTNALEATSIQLTANKTIDFSLKTLGDVLTGSMSGTVFDSANTGIKSKVIAILTNMIGSVGKYVVTVETDDNGNFTFDKLMYGEYIILSFPASKDWIPGYYKSASYTVLNWKDASLVKIANPLNGPISIKHALRTSKGITKIVGFLQEGKRKFVFDNLPATPLAGAMLYVVNADGKVVDYAYSDNNGKFNLDEVSSGTNTLIADKVGYETASTSVTTDLNTKSLADVSLSLSLMSVTGVEDNLSANVSLYPVPANGVNQLTLSGLANAGTYRIIDALGNELGNGNVAAGTAQIEISSLSTGNYYLLINSNYNLSTVHFSVIK